MCRQVEGNGKSLLTRSQITTIEGVGLLGSRETCILADGPRLEGVHHRVRATEIGRNTSRKVEVFHALEVFLRVDGTHLDMLWGLPVGLYTIIFNPLGTILSLDACIDINILKLFTHNAYFLTTPTPP